MKNKTQKVLAKASCNESRIREQTLNKWEHVGQTKKYLNASARLLCRFSEDDLLDELTNDDIIDIDGKCASKSLNVQRRIVRRIVEKRQAQNIHRIFGHPTDLNGRNLVRYYSHRCYNIIISQTI